VDFKKIIIAYEPVWAIGSGADREATPAESIEMAIFIKKVLSDMFGGNNAKNVKILYGGSVNAGNASDFLKHGGVDGLLVGRASMNPKEFNEIIKNA
jgi:triosephosphate isomerase